MTDVSALFLQLGIIFIIAAVTTIILRFLRQPQILAYVTVGILLGPVLRHFTEKQLIDPATIESTSLIGIAFLLFLVGLEMDLKSLRNVTFISTLGSLFQLIITTVLAFLVALLLGFSSLEAAYVGLIVALSSTMVVMKILSDRRELNTLHGKICIGFLIMSDAVAIIALSIFSSLNEFNIFILFITIAKLLILLSLAYLAAVYLFPSVFRFAARHQELLLITSLAVCFLFSLAFSYLGFSIVIGAFIAGIALGNLEYRLEIISKIKSLKDFFALLFFVSIGMVISYSVIIEKWVVIVILLFVVMVWKPWLIMTICTFFKYTKKPSFLTANALAQAGEFSLILASQGLILGHISQDLLSITVFVTLISIVSTSYYVEYSSFFYKLLRRPLKIFDRFTTEGLEYFPTPKKPKIVLCGYNRAGYSILKNLKKEKDDLLIVDYNPEIISQMIREQYHCLYGDVTDEEIIERLDLSNIEMLISTIPEVKDNLLLVKKTREMNKKAKLIITANNIEEAMQLYKEGADYVVLPYFLGGEHASEMIYRIRTNKTDIKEERRKHLQHLKERKDLGHEHPHNHH